MLSRKNQAKVILGWPYDPYEFRGCGKYTKSLVNQRSSVGCLSQVVYNFKLIDLHGESLPTRKSPFLQLSSNEMGMLANKRYLDILYYNFHCLFVWPFATIPSVDW